ncbi:MAG: histidine kinase, partial [Salinivenus sp.]
MVTTGVLLASFRVVATATLGVATVAAVRRRDKPVAPPFIWLLGVLAVWGGLVLLPGQFWIP